MQALDELLVECQHLHGHMCAGQLPVRACRCLAVG